MVNGTDQETERIRKIIKEEIESELNLKRNNPEGRSKKRLIIKTNYLRERIEHLHNKILFKIDNPDHIKKS